MNNLRCHEDLSFSEDKRHLGYENHCLEVSAIEDRILIRDDRVLANMLAEEDRAQQEIVDYCGPVDGGDGGPFQSEIRPHMRKIVLDWMLEVCQDQQCQPQTFHLAASYLDQYLSKRRLAKGRFQALGSGCLLLASKFSEVRPLTTEKLSLYTDNSVGIAELREWEMAILNVLEWQLAANTTHSFMEQLFTRWMRRSGGSSSSVAAGEKIRKHAEILAAIAVTEYKFVLIEPSLMAAACLVSAARGLKISFQLPAAFEAARPQCQNIHILVQHLEQLLNAFVAAAAPDMGMEIDDSSSSKVSPGKCQQQQQQQWAVNSTGREEGTTTPTDVHQAAVSCVGA